MIIVGHIPEVRSGSVFVVDNVLEALKGEEVYKTLINGVVQYFKVLDSERKLYKNIVGCMINTKPVLIQNVGYWFDLLEHNRISAMAIGCQLERVTNTEELKELNTRCRWS